MLNKRVIQLSSIFLFFSLLIFSFVAGKEYAQEQVIKLYGPNNELKDCPVELVKIEGGTFEMGDQFNEGNEDEQPVHKVKIDTFYLSKYEITTKQFCAFLNSLEQNKENEAKIKQWIEITGEHSLIEKTEEGFRHKFNYESHPMIKVTWYGAKSFCDWIGCRLPTEAEWEYAARNGGEKVRFSWGNSKSTKYANSWKYSGKLTSILVMPDLFNSRGTVPVGSFSPNKLGLYDMSGNAEEWCSDWYDEKYYKEVVKDKDVPVVNPQGSEKGDTKVVRGGSWFDELSRLRTANREARYPDLLSNTIGFRICR